MTDIELTENIMAAADRCGLFPGALTDIASRARKVFRLVEGVPTPFDPDSQTVLTGADGVTPITMDEWLESQMAQAPHLFQEPTGSDAQTCPRDTSVPLGPNPFRKETWNLTEQMRLQKVNPGLAAAFRACAK